MNKELSVNFEIVNNSPIKADFGLNNKPIDSDFSISLQSSINGISNAEIKGENNIEITTTENTINIKTKTFIFEQSIPSNNWIIKHNLNKFPSISIVDSAFNIVEGDVVYIDLNNIILKFSSSFSGKAFLN